MITITHTAAEGTLLDGTSRGDGVAAILSAQSVRWKWARTLKCWIIPKSRDQFPRESAINATAAALRAAGHDVEVSIDRTMRDPAEAEAARADRQADRAAALNAKADRRAAAAAAAEAAQQAAHDALPPFGEPIKIGHHSEHRHRRAIDKAWNTMGRAVEAHKQAEAARQRAETAAKTIDRRYSPITVANRIKKLEAEQRADQRRLDGHTRTLYRVNGVAVTDSIAPATGEYRERVTARMTARAKDIEYWQQVRAQQVEAGQTTNYSPETVKKGDWVRGRHAWHEVVRVNKATVSVMSLYIDGVVDRLAYQEIRGVRTAEEMEATA